MMHVLHVPFCYYPDPVGGTEVYVESLAAYQARQGLQVSIAAPGQADGTYTHDELPVFRYGTNPALSLHELYAEGDREAAAAFEAILDRVQPDIVHLHAFTSGVSLRTLRAAQQRRCRTVFTYHTPTVSCARGTLLRYGREVCSGLMDTAACSRCVLESRGLGRTAGFVLSRMPALMGRCASGRLETALRMRELTGARHDCLRTVLREVDRVVAVCEWVRDLLLRNGVDAGKVILSRQGLSKQAGISAQGAAREPGGPLRIAFLGRMSAVKGAPLLVEALLRRPALPVHLDLFGVLQDDEGRAMRDTLLRRGADDSRIRLLPPVPAREVVRTLQGYHLLAVPSQWLETGPLVVYEAFAAGIPVLGSALGGIAELVETERTGILVPHDSIEAWAAALERLATEPGLVERLRSAVRPPRTMNDAGQEMILLYRELLPAATGVSAHSRGGSR